MAKDLYQKSGQRLFIVREKSYGYPYDPETDATIVAWATGTVLGDTPIPADYPHWRRLDMIPAGQDIVIPLIEKLKKYDISDGKHPSAIFSGNIEPTEISLAMDAQGLEFLGMSFGPPVFSTHNRSITQTITCVAKAALSDNDYFLIDVIDTNDDVLHKLIWFDVTTGGSAPTVTGINAANKHEVAVDGCTTATDVADALEAVLEALGEITTANNVAEVITIVPAFDGAVQPARDGAATTGFTFSCTTLGSTTYTIAEATGYALPSFTIHAEQINSGSGASAEDIVYDLYGCIVKDIEVDVTFGNKIVTTTVTFISPYAARNTNGINTNNPPKKRIAAFPTFTALQEDTNEYVLMDSTTDMTPKAVDKVLLRIVNKIEFRSDISKRHNVVAACGKREVELEIVGWTDEIELFRYYLEIFKVSGNDWIPTGAAGKLNTKFKLLRDATYDYILVSIYNWLPNEHNFYFIDVDEAVKSVDIKLTDATGDSNGRIIDDCDYVSIIDPVMMTYNQTP